MGGVCYIIGAGDVNSLEIDNSYNDYIICADGGYDHAKKFNIKPDLIVGDFDSAVAKPVHEAIQSFPSEKDETDMMLAVNCGLEKGYKKFFIFGGLGGSRFDHSIANIQLLSYINKHKAWGVIIDDDTIVTTIKNASLSLNRDCTGYISIFSLTSKSYGVTIRNLKYELKNAKLDSAYPFGVSNEFIDKPCIINVTKGSLLIIFKGDYRKLL